MNDRYKAFCNALIGKQESDKFLKVFSGESDIDKYSRTFMENEKYWYINITRQIFRPEIYTFSDGPEYVGSTFFSVYMHKEKDFVVLKTSFVVPHRSLYINLNNYNNCVSYIGHQLRKKGFNKFEFTKEQSRFYGIYDYVLKNAKILVPLDKNEDDLANLMIAIDKYNDSTINLRVGVWDSFQSIKENIKIDW